MKKIITLAVLLASALALLNSCQLMGSLDEIQPEYVLTDETLITDATSAENAINGVYVIWKEYSICTARDVQFGLTQTVNTSGAYGGDEFLINNVTDENYVTAGYYPCLYKVVNMASSVIANIGDKEIKGLSDTRRKEIIAEASFQRAMAHFMLLRMFGQFWDVNSQYGIVTVTEPMRDNVMNARATVADSYKTILEDLEYAILNGSKTERAHYYASSFTAKCLKARVLLSKGDYAGAASVSAEAVQEGPSIGYALEDSYINAFAGVWSSPELVFVLHTTYPKQTASNTLYFLASGPGSSVSKLYEDLGGDTRFDDVYSYDGSSPYGNNKYQGRDDTDGPSNTYYFMRLSEVYFIEAEALVRQKKYDEARSVLAAVCTRAGHDAAYFDAVADKDLLVEIFKQKFMELFTENNEEWYDAVRYKALDGIDFTESGYVVNMDHLCMPLPRTALAGNSKLVQNP